jgi:hypothetical protein
MTRTLFKTIYKSQTSKIQKGAKKMISCAPYNALKLDALSSSNPNPVLKDIIKHFI